MKKESECKNASVTVVNASHLTCVFALFSSLVKGSAKFPCNKLRKRYIHVE